jgi:acyl-CoA thioesterase FadM
MNLYFRLLLTCLLHRYRNKVNILGPSKTKFRVLPNDLDLLMHMNNGRYYTLMDIARVDLMLRSGAWKTISKQGWYPVVVQNTLRFYKSLELFQRFTIDTHVVGWNDKNLFLEQRFMTGETVYASGIVKARFLKKSGGSVSTAELLSLLNIPHNDVPTLPSWVAAWDSAN